jgi:hypothetical protein
MRAESWEVTKAKIRCTKSDAKTVKYLDLVGLLFGRRGGRESAEEVVLHPHRDAPKQWGAGKGDVGAIPFAKACGMRFVGLGVVQSTLMRVAAIDPVASAMGVPTPTASKLGGQSLKSKLPV